MLYERWQAVARAHKTDVALWDADRGMAWTFGELERDAEALVLPGSGLVYPRSGSAAFVLEVLAAWRDGRPVCPLEPGQPVPGWSPPPAEVVLLKLTSATTGSARGVAFAGDQLAADVDQIISTMGLRADWPNLGVISLAHSYGFSSLVLPLVLRGIPLVVAGSAMPESVRGAARLVSNLVLPGVPALWRAWYETGSIPEATRLAISAGAPLPVELERAIHERVGVKVHNFYGASECGGIAYDRTQVPRPDSRLAGTPLDGVEVTLDDAGCLEVRSPAVGWGYWPDPDPRLDGLRYVTEDLAEIVDGGIHLCGRAGDVIHVAGRKVSPEVIERLLRGHPAVRDCLVLALAGTDPVRLDVIGAVVASVEPVEPESLRDFLLGRGLPQWQVPREWRFVSSLEPGLRGKVSRAEWRARLRG